MSQGARLTPSAASIKLVKRLQPLIIDRQRWVDQKKEADKQLEELNQAIEVIMVQANTKTIEVLDHRVSNVVGSSVSCKWDILRQRLLDLTEDVDFTEDIINEVKSK